MRRGRRRESPGLIRINKKWTRGCPTCVVFWVVFELDPVTYVRVLLRGFGLSKNLNTIIQAHRTYNVRRFVGQLTISSNIYLTTVLNLATHNGRIDSRPTRWVLASAKLRPASVADT